MWRRSAKQERSSPKPRSRPVCPRISRSSLHGNRRRPASCVPKPTIRRNIAFQRDIGFSTTAEIAWVGNFGRNFWRLRTRITSRPSPTPIRATLFNNEPITVNPIRRDYPGSATVRYLSTDEETLNYNAMQLSVQRRLHPRAADGPGVYALEVRGHPGL